MRKWSPESRAKLCGELHPNFKGDAAHDSSKRRRAVRLYPLTQCERCGEDATERHHIDGDTGNNKRENIAILCRRCHMTVDGRLEKFKGTKRQPVPPRPCSNCGAVVAITRRGICHACNEYSRRNNGASRPKDGGWPTPAKCPPCAECGFNDWPLYVQGRNRWPVSGAAYGVGEKICHKCYHRLYEKNRRAKKSRAK